MMKGMKWLETIVAFAIVALVLFARGTPNLSANDTPPYWNGKLAGVYTNFAPAYTLGGGLATSPHDFTLSSGAYRMANAVSNATVNGVTTNYITQTQYGLCTRCHTPHRALMTLLLWNHNLSSNTFAWDVPMTTAGTNLPGGGVAPGVSGLTYKGPSTKCLSCHDGSVATSAINWFNEGTPVPTSLTGFGSTSGINITPGGAGSMAKNHPLMIPYPIGGGIYNGIVTGTFLDTSAEYVANPEAKGIHMYQDTGSGNIIRAKGVSTNLGIECSSCHDVHNGPDVQGPRLLLGELSGNGGNYICSKCHIK